MTGRPANKDRQTAIGLGDKIYVGSVHKKCGTSERYVSGGSCVHCARVIATEQREARKYLQRRMENLALIAAPGGYPSSQGPLDKAEEIDLRQAAIDDLM